MTKLLVPALFLVACGTSIPVNPATNPQGASSAGAGSSSGGGSASCTKGSDCGSGQGCNTGTNTCEPLCTSAADCPGQKCDDTMNVCVAGSSASSSGSGSTHCTTKDDCQAGQVCISGACLNSSAGGSCHTEADCTATSASCANDGCTCTNGSCKVKAGAACTAQTAASVCAANQYCNNGTCTAATACTQQSQCQAAGLVCDNGYCKTPLPCTTNANCTTAGFTCAPSGYCLPDDTGKTCSGDTDCGSGYYCALTGGGVTGGIIGGGTGGTIGGGSTGGSGGTCQPGCKSNADCPVAGQTCDTLNTHQCSSGSTTGGGGGSTGSSCSVDTDCDPSCTNDGSSPYVCDITALSLSGVCRDRCMQVLGTTIIPCPSSSQTCISVSNPLQAGASGYCGSSPFGGFSYCQ